MKRCTKCGNENSMEGRFCEKCGGEMVASRTSGGGLKGSLSGSSRPSSTSSFEGSSTTPSVGSFGGSSLFSRPDGGPSSASSSTMSSSASGLSPMGSSPTSPPPVGSPTGSSLFSSPSNRSSSSSPPMGSSPMSSSPMGSSPTSSPPMGSPPVSPPPVNPSSGSSLVGSPPVGHLPVGPSTTYLEEKMKSIKRKMKITKVLAGVALLLVIVIAAIIFTRGPEYASTLTPEQIFEQNADAVFMVGVSIDGEDIGIGSAFFICSTGVAVTNHHVIYPVSQFQAVAMLYDERVLNITGFYSYDIDNDLAIIQVEGDGFAYTTLGDSDTLGVGATVSAIGSPYLERVGMQHNTINSGFVTTFFEEPFAFAGYVIPGLIQLSDFMIFGGNSGGPVFNDRGEVIGVVVASQQSSLERDSDGRRVANTRHIGFAVPINRLNISDIQSRQISALSLISSVSARAGGAPEHFAGIPDFLSISRNAELKAGGPAEQISYDEVPLNQLGFEYAYLYRLPVEHFDTDVGSYQAALVEQGFIWQGNDGDSIESGQWAYYYHPTQDITVALYYHAFDGVFLVAIGGGNIFENNHGGN